jgi:hypothetical protein
MAVPTLVTDLSTTAGSNSPAGSDNVFPDLDNYIRAAYAFIASVATGSGNGYTSPYLVLSTGGTVAGATTFSGAVTYSSTLTGGTAAITIGTTQFVKDASGNVGIGTSPTAKLHVSDPGTGLLFTNAASGNFNIGLLGGVGVSDAYIYQRANAPMIFATNNVERMRIDASGNVGIGGTPAAKLHVFGDSTSGEAARFIGGDRTFSISQGGTEAPVGGIAIYDRVAATQRLNIDSSGNVYGAVGAANMAAGFFHIPTAAGAPSGVPSNPGGRVPMYYDSTNNKLYIYNGAWKSVTLT